MELKERSAASANKTKWENPDTFVNPDKEVRVKDDIEVAASKATKMKEKFERKVRKEERKAKTPKPKARSVSVDRDNIISTELHQSEEIPGSSGWNKS